MSRLTHVNEQGKVAMVDVGHKPVTRREAVAAGKICMQAATLAQVAANQVAKGDVLATARIAGIQAAKRCAELIPLCHPLPLSKIDVDLVLDEAASCIHIQARCITEGKTGVEMEALTAVSVVALAVYDMCKAVDRGMTIEAIRLLEKSGGQSGHWQREA